MKTYLMNREGVSEVYNSTVINPEEWSLWINYATGWPKFLPFTTTRAHYPVDTSYVNKKSIIGEHEENIIIN